MQQTKEQLKELTSKRDRIENALKEALKEASAGTLPGGCVIYTYKNIFKKGYVVEGHSFRQLRRQLVMGNAPTLAKPRTKKHHLPKELGTLIEIPSQITPTEETILEPTDTGWYF